MGTGSDGGASIAHGEGESWTRSEWKKPESCHFKFGDG